MILQALKGYYDRKTADSGARMAPPGFEWKEVHFIIVLKPDGTPVSIEPTHEGEGKKRRAKSFLVPQAVKRASGIAANLLWDNSEYVLGISIRNDPKRVAEQHAAFKMKIDELGGCSDEALSAVKAFMKKENKGDLLESFGDSWAVLKTDGANVTFKLAGDQSIVTERPSVKKAILEDYAKQGDAKLSVCLATGQNEAAERLHAPIKGVYGAQTTGANIVSFNLDAFKSFGKQQGANAPVGKTAAHAYTRALNHLLARDSGQRILVGDATTVFWAERANDLEQQIADFFGEPPKDDPDRNVRAVLSLYNSINPIVAKKM
jgi:CRISPR-associated protein Csd1